MVESVPAPLLERRTKRGSSYCALVDGWSSYRAHFLAQSFVRTSVVVSCAHGAIGVIGSCAIGGRSSKRRRNMKKDRSHCRGQRTRRWRALHRLARYKDCYRVRCGLRQRKHGRGASHVEEIRIIDRTRRIVMVRKRACKSRLLLRGHTSTAALPSLLPSRSVNAFRTATIRRAHR